ncbi:MAG: hypothetical protein J2P32_06640 [Actinobacteria bacterium]|nr:hypothetical protein [Actinomycetota bacterium]
MTPDPAEHGPYNGEQQARDAIPAWWGLFDRFDHLTDACEDAGVAVGEYDRRVLFELAGQDPAVAAVVAGLITRAHSPAGPAGVAQPGGGWISGPSLPPGDDAA